MGESPVSVNESTAKMLQAMEQYYPGAMASINSMASDTARAQAEAGAAALPVTTRAQYENMVNYGPLMTEIGNQLQNQSSQGAMEGELALARGVGKDMASEARNLQELVDPEYFALREKIPGLTDKWLEAVGDPGKLSATEREEMSRGIAQRGFTNPNSAMDAAENAMLFGQASRARAMDFGNVVAQTANMLNPLAMSGVEVATRRPLTSNVGTNAMPAANQEGGNQAYTFGNNMWSGLQNYQTNYMAQKKDTLDKITQGTQAFANIGQGLGGVVQAGV